METKSSTNIGEPRPDSHALGEASLRPEQRLQQLCQGIIMQVLGGDAPRENAGFRADPTFRAEAGQLLVPHLEAGLRSLARVMRDDLLVRISNVQQLERLSGLDNDPSSISRMCHGEQPVGDLPLVAIDAEPALPIAELREQTTEPANGLVASRPGEAKPSEVEVPNPAAEGAAAEHFVRLAASCWRRGDQEQALAACSRAIQLAPAAAPAHLLRGQMYCLRREHDRALVDFTAVISAIPDHAEAFLKRGNAFLELGQLDQAVQDYSTALELKPGQAAVHLNRAQVYARKKAWQEAVADAGLVLQLQPNNGSAYFIRGSAYFQLGEPQKALADLNELLQIEPNNVLAYNERGLVRASLGEFGQALADYGRAIRLKPRFVRAHYNRAIALFQHGELDLALAALNELIQAVPDNEMVYYQRGLIHWTRREPDKAVADFTRALQLQPQFKQAEESLQNALQFINSGRRRLSSPQASVRALSELKEPRTDGASHQDAAAGPEGGSSTPVQATAPSEQKSLENPDESSASPEKEKANPNQIRLVCKECGTSGLVRFDRLDKKFQCRKCQRIYAVQAGGKLTEIVAPEKPLEKLKALAWQGLRLAPLAALLMVLVMGGWYVWHRFHSGRPVSLPHDLEPRAEMLTRAWLNEDADLVQLLTAPEKEGRVDAWLKANPFPFPPEQLKVSRSVTGQTKVAIEVLKEKRNDVQLRIQVSNPMCSPVNLEQRWVREGNEWYFQP